MKQAFCLLLMLCLAACKQEMTRQPKILPDSQNVFITGQVANRPVPAGTVATDDSALDREAATPPTPTVGLINRGEQRFRIFCTPCHGELGAGDGPVVLRGFPGPASFDEPRLVKASAEHVFDVITNGYGVMYPYGALVAPADRWAIIAYIRTLQLAHDPKLATTDAAAREPGKEPR